jgi:hypothetical protein
VAAKRSFRGGSKRFVFVFDEGNVAFGRDHTDFAETWMLLEKIDQLSVLNIFRQVLKEKNVVGGKELVWDLLARWRCSARCETFWKISDELERMDQNENSNNKSS